MPAYKFIVQRQTCFEQAITVWTDNKLDEEDGIPPELQDAIIDKAVLRGNWIQSEDWSGTPFFQYELYPDEALEDVDSLQDLDLIWDLKE